MYWMYFLKNLKVQFTYRFNVIFSLVATLCIFFTKVIVWQALYMGKSTVAGVTLDETIIYAVMSTIVAALMSTRIGETLGNNVYRGMVSVDFIRPVQFRRFYVAQDLAYIVHETINAGVLALIVVITYGQLNSAITLLSVGKFGVCLGMAVLLNYQLSWLLGLTSFWLQTAWHISWITKALIKTFSGTVVPLWFYPQWMLAVSQFLPYRYIYFDPIAILLNNNTLSFTEIFLMQTAWLIGISVAAHYIWQRAQRKVVVQGG